MSKPFELYLHPDQVKGEVDGMTLARHLEETGLIERAASFNDEQVKSWLRANYQYLYPLELRSFQVILWRSGNVSQMKVGCLQWQSPGLVVGNRFLEFGFGSNQPALLWK